MVLDAILYLKDNVRGKKGRVSREYTTNAYINTSEKMNFKVLTVNAELKRKSKYTLHIDSFSLMSDFKTMISCSCVRP